MSAFLIVREIQFAGSACENQNIEIVQIFRFRSLVLFFVISSVSVRSVVSQSLDLVPHAPDLAHCVRN